MNLKMENALMSVIFSPRTFLHFLFAYGKLFYDCDDSRDGLNVGKEQNVINLKVNENFCDLRQFLRKKNC
jgi:hypothetical protein